MTVRKANAIIVAVITAFFFTHATIGSSVPLTGLSRTFEFLVWGGVALIAVHMVLSLIRTVKKLTDPEDPPTGKKKRKLALKWGTGATILLCAAIHLSVPASDRTGSLFVGVTTVLMAALAVHVCVMAKPLLKHLGFSGEGKNVLRVLVVVAAVAVGFVFVYAWGTQ